MQLPPWTKRPSPLRRPFYLATFSDPRHETLLCILVPSPPQAAGSLNLTLGLSAQQALSRQLSGAKAGSPITKLPESAEVRAVRLHVPEHPLLVQVWGLRTRGSYAATGSTKRKAEAPPRRKRGNSSATGASGAGPTSQ